MTWWWMLVSVLIAALILSIPAFSINHYGWMVSLGIGTVLALIVLVWLICVL